MPEVLNPTTYEITLSGGDKVEIGDINAADFKPHIKLNRWEGECFIKVSLPTAEKSAPVVEGDKVKFKGKDIEADFYPLEPTTVIAKDKDGRDVEFTQNELGGFEFEVILKKKPKTNKIILDIETQGLKFYYQPPLTAEEIADGAIRPDNVVGSYAVYHATRTNMHRGKADAEKYKCGKAFHIYRPRITDAEGKWDWGELSLDEQAGTLTTAIPQNFLDVAVYPVSTGTTLFGWTGEGKTVASLTSNTIREFGAYSPEFSGLATKLTIFTQLANPGIGLLRGVIYLDSNLSRITYGGEVTNTSLTAFWLDLDIADEDIIGETGYLIGVWIDFEGGSYNQVFYDTEAGLYHYKDNETYHATNPPPATFTKNSTYSNLMYSIYCTYEEAAEGETYDETGREQVILAIAGRSDLATFNELEKDQTVLATIGEIENFLFPETGKEQVILAAQSKGEQLIKVEGLAQTILATVGKSEQLIKVESRSQVVLAVLEKLEQLTKVEHLTQTILAVVSETDLATWNELNKLLTVLVVQESIVGTRFYDLEKEQVILAVIEKAEQLIKVETREQVILAVQSESDLATFLETLKAQVVLARIFGNAVAPWEEVRIQIIRAVVGEADQATFDDKLKVQTILSIVEKLEQLIKVEAREQTILAVQEEADLLTLVETLKQQIILGVVGETDLATFLETLKAQTILAMVEAIAGLTITETEREQIILAVISGDARTIGVIYEEIRTQIIRAVAGETDQLAYVESREQVILAIQAYRLVHKLIHIKKPPAVHDLGRTKSVPYNLGRSLVDYTLGRRR